MFRVSSILCCAVGKILPHFNSILTFLHFFFYSQSAHTYTTHIQFNYQKTTKFQFKYDILTKTGIVFWLQFLFFAKLFIELVSQQKNMLPPTRNLDIFKLFYMLPGEFSQSFHQFCNKNLFCKKNKLVVHSRLNQCRIFDLVCSNWF